VQPRKGMASIFEVNNAFHEGQTVLKGEKYILRTDIVYSLTRDYEGQESWILQRRLANQWFKAHTNEEDAKTWDAYQATRNELGRESMRELS
jgi:hypothetical protein